MRRLYYFVLPFLFFLLFVGLLCVEGVESWHSIKGDHFFVYYTMGERRLAQAVLRKAESDYSDIADFLRYPRRSDFWTWDKRVSIYIYPDKEGYLKETDTPEWSNGVASYEDKTISSYAGNKDFLETVLPHEMAHFIFRDFVGFREEIPIWLDAGIAQWAVTAEREEKHKLVRAYADAGTLIPLREMMKIHPGKYKTQSRTFVQPSLGKTGETVMLVQGDRLVTIYYLQAVSIVGFLIERFGPDSFAVFCRELRDGKDIEEALAAAYPKAAVDLESLQEAWLDHVRKK